MTTFDFEPGSVIIEGDGRRAYRKSDIAPAPGGALTASAIMPAAGNVKALLGWALAETTGTAGASIRLRDGLDAKAQVFARINLSSNESTRDTLAPTGIVCTTGEIFLEWISGSIEGVLYWR